MLQPRRRLLLWTVAAWLSAILLSALVECSSSDSSGGLHGLPDRPKRDSADVTTVLLVEGRGRYQDKPEGLLTSTARTFVQEGTTTEFATQVLGTRLDNGRVYARVLSTSSRVFYDGRDVARKTPPSLPPYLADIVRPTLVFPAQAVQQTVEPFGTVKSGQVYQTAVNAAQSKYSPGGGVPGADVITVAAVHHVEAPPQHHTRYFNVEDPIHKDTFAEEEFASKVFAQKQQQELNDGAYTSSSGTDEGEESYNLIKEKKLDFFKRNVDKQDQNRANFNDVNPAKVVRPLEDLPTITVRHEFSPSGFSSEEEDGTTESRKKDLWGSGRIRNGKALFRNGVLMPDQRKLDTVTYMGFADFTTTVGDTVIVFMPNTASQRQGAGRKATSISGDATLPASRRVVTSVKTFMSHTPAMATRTVTGHSLSMQTTIPTMVVLPETSATSGRPRKNKGMESVFVIEAVTEQEGDVQPDPVTDKETYLSREQGHFEAAPEQPDSPFEHLEPSIVTQETTSEVIEPSSVMPEDVASLFQPEDVIQPSEVVTEAASQEIESNDEEQTATEEYKTSATVPLTSYRTAQTQLFPNADEEFPLGLIKAIGGTEVVNGTTTLFTSLVYGTNINGDYAQIVHSTSSIFFYIGETKVNMEVRKDIEATSTAELPHTTSTATTLQEEPEYTTPQPTVPSTEEEQLLVTTEGNRITTLQQGTTEGSGIATTNGERAGTTFNDDTLSTIPMDETTTPEMDSELSNEVETGRKVVGHSRDQVITEKNQEQTTPNTVEDKTENEIGTTNQDVISTTPSEAHQDVVILSSGDFITRLVPTTVYQTFTYLTTFFIPAEGSTTTTSVRSREVVTSDVSFVTHVVNATVHGNTYDLFTSAPTTAQIEGTLQTISPESIRVKQDTPTSPPTTPKAPPQDERSTMSEESNTSPTPPIPTTTEEDLELIYKTLYTTYTYLTTFFEESTTSVSSREVVITNVLTSTLGHDFLLQASDPAVAGLFAREDSLVSPTASDVHPSPTSVGIGRPTEKHFPDFGNNPDENIFSSVVESVDIEKEMAATPSLQTEVFDPSAFDVVKTFYTTYTYFTTIFVDGETTVSSRTEIYTNVVTPSGVSDAIKPTASLLIPRPESDQINAPQQNVEDTTRIESPLFKSTPRMSYNSTITRDHLKSAMNEVENPAEVLASKSLIRNDDENSIFVTKNTVKYESEYATISRSHVAENLPIELVLGTSSSKSPISSRDVTVLSSTVKENPVVVETMSTDVRSSTSGGEKVMMLDRNDKNVILEDQISSESNTEELHPSPTLLLQTSFTTFTYFTTVYKGSTSSDVISRLETVTNVVTETITPQRSVLPTSESVAVEDPSLPITYFTTFTYWTTLFKDGTTTVTSREDTVSEVVTPTVESTPTLSVEIVPTATPEKELEPTTYFTTFTYYTTSYIGNNTVLNSRLETVTNIVNGTEEDSNDLTGRAIGTSVVGQLPPTDVSKTESTAALPTGLLSTIVSSAIDNGTTTLFSTDVYGTYIDGLYAKVLESSTQVVTPTLIPAPVVDLQPTGVVSLNEGKIIDADGVSTTYFTTHAVGTYVDKLYAQVITSTTSIKVDNERKTALLEATPSTEAAGKTFKTGLVRLIEGSIVKDKTTTYYESRVVGTVIDGRYAQIIESTSSFKVAVSSTTVPADIVATSTQNPALIVTSTLLPSTTPSSVVIESSLNEEGEKSEKDEGENVEDEDEDGDGDRDPDKSGSKSPVRTRLRYSSTKKSVISSFRPFSSRNRPPFQPPRRKATAATVTRTTFTPTITATPAAKTESRSRFTGNRRQSSSQFNSGANEIRPTASSSRRFSRVRGSSTAGGGFGSSSYGGGGRGRSSSRISPTATSGPAGSSRRGGYFRSSSARGGLSDSGGRGSSSTGHHSSSRFRIRPTQSVRTFNSAIYTTPLSDETLEPENDLTTIMTEETPQYTETDDGETPTLPIQATTESSRRSNNPLLRFRRPPVPRVTPVTSTTPKPATIPARKNNLLRPASNRAASTTPRPSTKVRPTQTSRYAPVNNRRPSSALFPPRGLFKRPGQDEEEEEKRGEDEGDEQDEENPDDEEHQEEDEEDIGDNEYEGSETSEAKTSASKRVKPVNQVQIRPFIGFKRRSRTKRQADYGSKSNSGSPRSYSSRFRRPGSSNRKNQPAAQERADIEEEPPKPSTEPPKAKPSGRYTPRIRSQTPSQPRVKPTAASTSATRSQFTLREKDTSSTRSSFRRPSTSSPSRRRSKQPEATSTPSRPKPPRLRSQQSDTTTHSRSNRRYSNTKSNTNTNTRRGSPRSRFHTGETTDFDTYTYSQSSFDGTITVTHHIPTEVTIPVVNGKVTEYRNVVTASASTEVLSPHQYTSSAGRDGTPVLLLTSEVTGTLPGGVTEITQFVLHETPTSSVIFTPTTIRGRKTSYSHLIPSTVYDVEQVVSTIQPQIAPNAPLANILLSQLLLGNLGGLQPNLNPLLALTNAGTPPTPTTEYKTRATTYVTTVTKGTSTVIPLTFRGKEICTTIVDSSEEVITATEFITDTVVITPTATVANNQLNSLLIPALLQAQLLGNQQGMQQQQQQVSTNPLLAGLQQQQLLQQQPQLLEPQKNLFQEPDNEEPVVEEEEKPAPRRQSQKRNRNRNRPVEEPDRQARESEKDFLQEDTVQNSREEDQSRSSWKPPRKMKPRNPSGERKPPDVPPVPAETSVVTLYVSGRRPGEFSTVLSTVTLGEESSIRKRETGHPSPSMLPMQASHLPELGSSFHVDNYVQSAMNELGLENSETETQSLESIVGDVSNYVSVTKKLHAKSSVNTQPTSITNDDVSSTNSKKDTGHFLSKGPAELAPLKRKVESSLYRGTETNKKAIVKSKPILKLNLNDSKEISLSRERRSTDEHTTIDSTSSSPSQRRRRVRIRVPVHKKRVDHEEVLSLSEAQHMDHVTDMELMSPIQKGKKQAAVSLSDFGLKLSPESAKDDGSEHHRKRIIITRRRKPSSSTDLLEATTPQPVLQTETPEPPLEKVPKVSKPNARRRIVVTKKRPIPVAPTSTSVHRRRIVVTKRRPVHQAVKDDDEPHEDIVPTSVTQSMETGYLHKYTAVTREKGNGKIMKTSPMFMSGNIPPAFISHYDDDDSDDNDDEEEEVNKGEKAVIEKEEKIEKIMTQAINPEVTSPVSPISYHENDSPIITIKPLLERPNITTEAIIKHFRSSLQGKPASKVTTSAPSATPESIMEDTTVSTSTVDYIDVPETVSETVSEHTETTTSMAVEVTDEDKIQLNDEVKVVEVESFTTITPMTEQGSVVSEGTTEGTEEGTVTITPEESVIVTTPESPETSTYEGPKFFRPTRFSITRRPQRTRTSFPGRRRTSEVTSSSTATRSSSKAPYRFRKPSSTRSYGHHSKTQELAIIQPSTTAKEVKPTTIPVPETTEAQPTEATQEIMQIFTDEDTTVMPTTENMDSSTELDSTPPLEKATPPQRNEPSPSLRFSSQDQGNLPTLSTTTEDQFVTRTVTQTRLRTYTYIVTRVAGTDQLVTSTTEVKPHVTTVTLTQPLPAQTDFGARGLSLNSNEARYNLATKVMSNGVEVIVAGDKSTLPGDPQVLRVLSSAAKPTTLAPSTLTDHMMMLLPQDVPQTSSQQVTKTFLTTFTYLTTYMQNGHTSVASREHTVTNVATEDPGLGPSEVHTGLTVTSTVTDAIKPTTMDVLKTYFVTYTYYRTLLEGGQTVVRSEVATSSDVVTEKVYLSPKRTTTAQEPVSQTEPLRPLYVFATKTYLTTFTYFTTLLQAAGHDSTSTIVSSRTRVVQNIVTDIIPPSLLGSDYLLSLQNSFSGTPIVATATLSGGQHMTITAMENQGAIIKPSATVTVEQTASVDLTSSMGETSIQQELASSMEDHTSNVNNIITGSTIIFFDDDDHVDSSSSALGTVAIDVPGGQTGVTPALVLTPSAQNTVINTGAATVIFPVTPQALTSLVDVNVPPQVVTSLVSEPVVKPPTVITTILATSTVTAAGTTLRPGDEVIMMTLADGNVTMIPASSPLNKQPSGGQITAGPGGSEIQVSDLLSLGSLGINGFNALGPVINAMAGLIQSNLQHSDIRRNDTSFPEVTDVPRPVYVASSPPPRQPVYIPLGGMVDGAAAESQNYEGHVKPNGENLGWKLQGEGEDEIFPDTQQRHRPVAASLVMGRPTLENPLLGDGIPISPGQVITANSDVIIGKPAILGPRPPKIEAPIGMRPPPPPVWGDKPNKHKFTGGHQPHRDESPVSHNQNHPGNHHGAYHPLRGNQIPLRPPTAGSDHRPVLVDIPLSHQFQLMSPGDSLQLRPGNVIHEIPLRPTQPDMSHAIQGNSVNPAHDSSSGQSLLVNIQPSQVANVLVQHVSIAPEHDPAPFPLPELSPEFVGYDVDPMSHYNPGGNQPGSDTQNSHHHNHHHHNHQGTNGGKLDISYKINHGTSIAQHSQNHHNGNTNSLGNFGTHIHHNGDNLRLNNDGQHTLKHGSANIHKENNNKVGTTGSNIPSSNHHGGNAGGLTHLNQNTVSLGNSASNVAYHSTNGEYIGNPNHNNHQSGGNIAHQTVNNIPSNDGHQNSATSVSVNNHHSKGENAGHHSGTTGSFGHPTYSNGMLNHNGADTSSSGHHSNFQQGVNTRPVGHYGHHTMNNAVLGYHNTDLDIHGINTLPLGLPSLDSYPSSHHEGDTGIYGNHNTGHSGSIIPFVRPTVDTHHLLVDSTHTQHGVGTVHEETDTDTRMDPETGINVNVSPGSDFNVEVTPGHFQQHGISEHGIVLDAPLPSRPDGPTNKRPGSLHRPLHPTSGHHFPHQPSSNRPHRPMDFMTPPPPPPSHTGTSPIIIPLNPNSPQGPRPKPGDLLISADKDDSGEADDPLELEGGEVIQATNSRPLRPGQLPSSSFTRRPTQKPENKFTHRPTVDEMLHHTKPEEKPLLRWPPPLGQNHKVSGKPHTPSPGFNQYQQPPTNNEHSHRPRPGPAILESSTLDDSHNTKPWLEFGQKPPPLPNFDDRPSLPSFDNKYQPKPSVDHTPQFTNLAQPPHLVKPPSQTDFKEEIVADETHSPPPKIDVSSEMSTVDKPPKPLFDLETQANTPRPFIRPPDLEKISDDSVMGLFPPPPHVTIGSNSGIQFPGLQESTHRPVVNIGGQRRPSPPLRVKPQPQDPYKFEIHTSTTETIRIAPPAEHKTTTNRPPLYEIPGPSSIPGNELKKTVSTTTHRPQFRPWPPQPGTSRPSTTEAIPTRKQPTTSTTEANSIEKLLITSTTEAISTRKRPTTSTTDAIPTRKRPTTSATITSTTTTLRTSTTTAPTVSTKASTPKPYILPPKRPAVVPTPVKDQYNKTRTTTLQKPTISPTSVKYTVIRNPTLTSEQEIVGSETQLREDIRHSTPIVGIVNKATDHSVIVSSGSKTVFGGLYTKSVVPQMETVQKGILKDTSSVINDSEESDTSVEIKKNDLGVASSNDDSVVFESDDDDDEEEVVVPTRYITHTQTLTVTTTETTILSSEGHKPSTRTVVLTKTHTSTIVDTVTETKTLVRPTKVVATVTTTVSATATTATTQYPPGSPFDPANFPSFPVKISTTPTITTKSTTTSSEAPQGETNESMFVVVNDQHPGSEDDEVARREEADEVNHAVLLGGVLIAAPPRHNAGTSQQPQGMSGSSCRPDCSPSRNELCQRVEGQMRCVCRPGFARMFPDRPCKPTYTYHMHLGLSRLGQKPLRYEPTLANHTAPRFQKLAEASRQGLDRMVMQSDLRDIFHGVVVSGFQPAPKQDGVLVDFYVQLSDNTDEARLKDVFRKSLRSTNYSLGGTELYADKEQVTHLQAEDFDECESSRFHDCSEHARCFNLRGTYTCSCKEGFADLSENALFPGRVCSAEQIGCEKCHYHGTCYSRGDDQVLCECFQWYAGENCHINLKVLLIALVTIGAVLLMLLLVCVVLTCLKRGHRKQGKPPGFLRYRGPAHQTLDKRAMIQDTSSEGSIENGPPPPIAYMTPTQQPVSVFAAKVRQQAVGPGTLQSSAYNTEQRDRSLTVMIPRAKYRPVPPTSPMLTMSTFGAEEKRAIAQEQKLIALLEGKQVSQDARIASTHRKSWPAPSPPGDPTQPRKMSAPRRSSAADRPQRSSETPPLPLGALVSAGFEVSATVGKQGCGDSDTEVSGPALDMASPGSNFTTLRTADSLEATDGAAPEPQPATGSGVQELTVSEARSFDETTVQAPTKCLHSNYGSGSKPSSRNLNNDEAHTMAERDLGSTFLMPQTHLYKPDRGSDISNFDSL